MALFERTTLLIDANNVANGNVPIAPNGVAGAFDLIAAQTPNEGLVLAIQVTGGGTRQATITLQESADGITAVVGGRSLPITCTGAEGYKSDRWRSLKGGRYIISTGATVTNGPIPKLRLGFVRDDAEV